MKYSNELKVGLTIIIATLIFVLGARYFEDLPLFRGTFPLETEFKNASGLIAGNVVRINGVTVGSVDEVMINPQNNRVRVLFHVDRNVPVPEGSHTLVSGFDALGVTRMDVVLGDPTAARIPSGGFVQSKATSDLMGSLSDKAPVLMGKVDSVLTGLNGVLSATDEILGGSKGDLRATITSMRSSSATLESVLRNERVRIQELLTNVTSITGSMDRFMTENSDSIAVTVNELKTLIVRLDATLSSLDQTTEGLNTLLVKLNDGQGTLGMLINDPSMYHRTDSILTSIDALLVDFRSNPGRYLKELRLVDIL